MIVLNRASLRLPGHRVESHAMQNAYLYRVANALPLIDPSSNQRFLKEVHVSPRNELILDGDGYKVCRDSFQHSLFVCFFDPAYSDHVVR